MSQLEKLVDFVHRTAPEFHSLPTFEWLGAAVDVFGDVDPENFAEAMEVVRWQYTERANALGFRKLANRRRAGK